MLHDVFHCNVQEHPPPFIGFAWSADSYQLASLDASSHLRLWWLRPEQGQGRASLLYTVISYLPCRQIFESQR